jgi:hypothetical protein
LDYNSQAEPAWSEAKGNLDPPYPKGDESPMKWSDPKPAKAYFMLMAVVSLIIAALAGYKWGP